jgi:hypothetical protein
MAQVDELIRGYDFDGFFFDMTFWPAVCLCEHCREAFRSSSGREIPETIDWMSEEWCEFQAARDRWMSDFAGELSARAKQKDPSLPVYHNFATAILNWTMGLPFSSAQHHDFLGADFYGDPTEQLVVSKLMMNLTNHKPLEFMTSACVTISDHVRMKSFEQMQMQVFASTLFSGAFLFIDAINPDGTANTEVADTIGRIYRQTAPYEPFLGGDEVADIAVYYSSESKIDFAENGSPLAEARAWNKEYPHAAAVRGVCRTLQRAHVPFGVITRKNIDHLANYKVVILPNVLRMDTEECEALRRYVRGGGNLYASRYTSLTETRGVRRTDFMLADVFGCHYKDDSLGRVLYLRPSSPEIAELVSPQSYVSHFVLGDKAPSSGGALELDDATQGDVLARVTLPYARDWGTIDEHNWSSIHSSPPWQDVETPAIVRNAYGLGRSIYSAADIECMHGEMSERLFLGLIRSLLGDEPGYTADVHPSVWMSVFHQPEKNRFIVGFLNYQAELPAIPIGRIPFTLKCPENCRFVKLVSLPDMHDIPFSVDSSGRMHAEAEDLGVFLMLTAEYQAHLPSS